MPALRAARSRLSPLLQGGGRGSAGPGPDGQRLRAAMVVGQVALALVLMVGATLTLRSVVNLLQRDLGFEPRGVSARVVGPGESAAAERLDFFQRLRQAGATIPGVEELALVDALPAWGGQWVTVEIDGRAPDGSARVSGAEVRRIGPDFLSALRIPLLVGRGIGDRDTAASPRVAVVNRRFVEEFFPDLSGDTADDAASLEALGSVIGHTVTGWLAMGAADPDFVQPREIVGVVGSVREWGYSNQEIPLLYVPYPQDPTPTLGLLARGDGATLPAAGAIRDLVASVDPRRPVDRVEPLETKVRGFHRMHDFVLALLTAFACVAVTLSAVGLYGVMAYQVADRTPEIGVRAALGADRGAILRLVLGRGLALGAVGIAAGVLAALPLARFFSGLLFERMLVDVAWWDPVSFTVVPALLLATVAAACMVPALRATRVNPVETLRR